MITTVLQVALGGAIGAALRFLTGVGVLRLVGPGFPMAIITVNIVGSFLMGVFVVAAAHRGLTHLAPFVMTGVLGGFTTSESGKYSPGSLFLLDLLEKETREGNTHTFDFSIGDEAYKDDWCELHFPLFDYKAASSLKGLLALLPLRLAARIKRFLKQSPRAWALTQTIRKRLGQLRRG